MAGQRQQNTQPQRQHGSRRWVAAVPGKLIAGVLGAVAVLALIVGVCVWAFPVFTVKEFEVTGNDHVRAEQVEEASGVTRGSNLMRVDARQAAANIVGIDWVETVTVSRSLPSTLRVDITEYQAAAYVTTPQGTQLVDPTGKPFAIGAPPPEAIELVGDVADDPRALHAAVNVVAALPEAARGQVRALEVAGPYSITVVTDDDRRVYWGASEDNANKAFALEDVLRLEGREFNISNPEMVTSR